MRLGDTTAPRRELTLSRLHGNGDSAARPQGPECPGTGTQPGGQCKCRAAHHIYAYTRGPTVQHTYHGSRDPDLLAQKVPPRLVSVIYDLLREEKNKERKHRWRGKPFHLHPSSAAMLQLPEILFLRTPLKPGFALDTVQPSSNSPAK